ncbi:MAG: T9SS type B sorting domain-containing protein [Chitinophagaceae bacterium]
MKEKEHSIFLTAGFICCVVFLLSFCSPVNAQLCTGSLGDPVLNQTFGKGPIPAQPLSAAATSYRYNSADCPTDGSYTLLSETRNCFNSWHTVVTDHTGDGQGYFMLVNASFAPSDFYVDTVRGMCANTSYEFSAWLMNMVRASNQINPNITFTIEETDGTVLGQFSSGPVTASSTPRWNKYGLFFKTPPGTFDVVVRMRNNAPGGIGNDIALDDIAFRACGPLVSTRVAGTTAAINLCAGDQTTFMLNSEVAAGYTAPLYQWQVSINEGRQWRDLAGGASLNYERKPTTAGRYLYRLTVVEAENAGSTSCRIGSSAVLITGHENPLVNAGPDRVVLKGERTQLQGSVIGDSTLFTWSPQLFLENANSVTPTVKPELNTGYTLSAASVWGCKGSDSVYVKVVPELYIPTAFTPNGDGLNDLWRIPDLDPSKGAEVRLFNRLGQMGYFSRGMIGWDGKLRGKLQPSGVFIYLIDLKTGLPPLKGSLLLVR